MQFFAILNLEGRGVVAGNHDNRSYHIDWAESIRGS